MRPRRGSVDVVDKKSRSALACRCCAVLTTGKEGGVAGSSDFARVSQRADAYNRYGAELLRRIARLPCGHPERKSARAKLLALRPKALEAIDALRLLEIRYALRLHDKPTGGMS